MLPTPPKNNRQTNGTSRRYSLFNHIYQSNETTRPTPSISARRGTVASQICPRCKRPETEATNVSDSEIRASRQVISLLQRQLELVRIEKEGLEASQSGNLLHFADSLPASVHQSDNIGATESCSKNVGQIVDERLALIVKLQADVKKLKNDKEAMAMQVHLLEEDNARLRSQDANQVSHNERYTLRTNQQHIEKLNDMIEAYKRANESLRKDVMDSRSRCLDLEAKCSLVTSKLLSLLKEIEQSFSQSENPEGGCNVGCDREVIHSKSVKLLMDRLLADDSLDIPLSWKEGNKSKKDKKEDIENIGCDELGFYMENGDNQRESETSPEISNFQTTQLVSDNQSSNLVYKSLTTVDILAEYGNEVSDNKVYNHRSIDATKMDEERWRSRWDDFMRDYDKVDLTKKFSKEFKSLLISGIPQDYRCKVWKSLIDVKIGSDRQRYGPDFYQSLLSPNRHDPDPFSKQISIDLMRTLPTNKHFVDPESIGITRLRRLLTAYARFRPETGYCQGMNRLAAVALLVMTEEDAFWLLTTIIEKIMPENYYRHLWLAHVDSNFVLLEFVRMKIPNLYKHFRSYNIDLSLFAWFLTIFIDGAPPALFLRVWDSFLWQGDKILFRIALALLKMHENQLLQLNNSVEVNNFLRASVKKLTNMDQLFDIAFGWVNPLSAKSIKIKRQHYLETYMRSGFASTGRSSVGPSPVDEIDDEKNDDSSIISI